MVGDNLSAHYDDGSNDWSPLTKELIDKEKNTEIIPQKEVWLRCFSNLICNGTLSTKIKEAADIADNCLEEYNKRFN